jgi:hypothetical protein
MMSRPSRALLVLGCLALAVGLAEPPLEVAWKCRAGFESSEACVWGRAFLPLGRAVGLVIITPVTFAVLYCIRWVRQSRSQGSQPPD